MKYKKILSIFLVATFIIVSFASVKNTCSANTTGSVYYLTAAAYKVKGYVKTSGIVQHHAAAYIGNVKAFKDSSANVFTGGLHVATTSTIENYGSYIGIHYDSGYRSGCYCLNIL